MKAHIVLAIAVIVGLLFPEVGYPIKTYAQKESVEQVIGSAAHTGEEDVGNHGIWILRNGKYFAKSPTLAIVFRKGVDGIVGFAYYRESTNAYCFWGDLDAGGNLFAEKITTQEIHSAYSWILGERSAIDLNRAVVSTQIALSNLEVMFETGESNAHEPYIEMSHNSRWPAVDFCDAFFAAMDSGPRQ